MSAQRRFALGKGNVETVTPAELIEGDVLLGPLLDGLVVSQICLADGAWRVFASDPRWAATAMLTLGPGDALAVRRGA